MKILFVTSVVPYPPHRGDKLRIFNVIKHLALNNQVKVVSFVKDSEEEENAETFKKLGYNITTLQLNRRKGLLNLFRTLWTWEPFQVSFHYSAKMHQLIKGETSNNDYDIVYFHLFTVAQYYVSVKSSSTLKVYDITDASALYLKRYIEFITHPLKKMYFAFELNRLTHYEKIDRFFDLCMVCSKTDLDYLCSHNLNSNLKLFTNGFDAESFIPENLEPQKHRIIFAGSMPYFPNKDAALFFAKEVFPLVKEKFQDAVFYIVGQNPPEEILALASESIVVTGFVTDIKKEYLLSEINVAPIRFGAGIQNKIIESLALGIPTIASKISVSSFDENIRKYIFTAETAPQYADAVIKIFENPSIKNDLMKECIKTIRENMTWEKIVGEAELEFNLLINKKRLL